MKDLKGALKMNALHQEDVQNSLEGKKTSSLSLMHQKWGHWTRNNAVMFQAWFRRRTTASNF